MRFHFRASIVLGLRSPRFVLRLVSERCCIWMRNLGLRGMYVYVSLPLRPGGVTEEFGVTRYVSLRVAAV